MLVRETRESLGEVRNKGTKRAQLRDERTHVNRVKDRNAELMRDLNPSDLTRECSLPRASVLS